MESAMNDHPCHAEGCLLHGTMTAGDPAKMLCFVHFGAPADEWNAITVQVRRLDWLTISVLRLRYFLVRQPGGFNEEAKSIYARLKLAQRADLLPQKNEGRKAWALRLESELRSLCRAPQEELSL
jgi:hypothetical protein